MNNVRWRTVLVFVCTCIFTSYAILSPQKPYYLMVTYVGTLCNCIAVFCNGGKMPVKTTSVVYVTDNYKPVDSSTRFKILCDIFETRRSVYSIGDILIYAGIALFVLESVCAYHSPSNLR